MSAFKKLKRRNNEMNLHEELIHEAFDDEDVPKDEEAQLKRQKIQERIGESSSESEDDSQKDEKDGEQDNGSVQEDQDKEGEEEEVPANVVTEVDPEDELRAFTDADPAGKEWKNRQRVLMIAQRGLNGRHRHLMNDLIDLIPHSKTQAKMERGSVKDQIDQTCFERSCNQFLYFESRAHKEADLYMWLSKSPNGPAFKFSVSGIKTVDELKLTGNCLKYSRPIVSFDGSFNDPNKPHLQLLKEMLSHTFNTPKNHPKSKPFIDHVITFNYFENKVYFRNYQILNQHEKMFKATDDISKLVLIEIGPRFVMNPIKCFEGSMGGPALWQNTNYIAPSKMRSKKMATFKKRRDGKVDRKAERAKIWNEGRDPNSYLEEAFEENDDSEQSDE